MQAPGRSQSILIILMGALGDVARGVALLPPLKAHFPESRISWLIAKKWQPFLELHPLIDQIIPFDKKAGLRGVLETCRQLREQQFDVSLDLQRHLKSGIFARFSGARRRIGFHPSNAKEGNWLFNSEHICARDSAYSKILHYHDFLAPLGINWSGQISFGFEAKGRSLQEAPDLPDNSVPRIGLVLGSSWESKDWTSSGYRDLLDQLKHRQIEILLLGDKSQVTLAEQLLESSGAVNVRNLVGKTSLQELVACIAGCTLLIGPDSGPAHVAACFQVPYIGLFGPTHPSRVAAFGSEHLSIRAGIGCSPCLKRRCPGLQNLCMKLIPQVEIIRNIEQVLAGKRKGASSG